MVILLSILHLWTIYDAYPADAMAWHSFRIATHLSGESP